MAKEGDLTLSDEHTMQYADGILQNHTLENYVTLLINVTTINLIKMF